MKSIRSKSRKMTHGGRNLVILGIVSILMALATTGVSLAIYHNSGDIYLDRSRPGFLPDEKEVKQEEENKEEYVLEKSGELTMETVEEYLKELQSEVREIDVHEKPFDESVLSDEKLGISEINVETEKSEENSD